MYQRHQTVNGDAPTLLGRLTSLDSKEHPSSTLGDKVFRGQAYNPAGPQRRVQVVKTGAPSTPVFVVPRSVGGRAPQRTFSR